MGVFSGGKKRGIVVAISLSFLMAGCGGGGGGGTPAPTPSPTATVGPVEPPSTKPNILFIIADDLRPEIGAYGAPIVQTPNIDAFAATGALFERSYVSMAICSPSRFVLMTGLRPDTSGLTTNDVKLDTSAPSLTTMMDQFRSAGYDTESIGKVYHYLNDDANGWTYQFRRMEDYFDKSAGPTSDPTRLIDTVYAQQAIDRMGVLKKSAKPFFMAVGFRRPHMPFLAPPVDWARYSTTHLPAPRRAQTGSPYFAFLTSEPYAYADLAVYNKDQYLPADFPKSVSDNLFIGYLASVSYIDGLVGKILNQLKALGLENKTIVVFWGDNGYKLGDYGYWTKASNAEIDIRVPLIIRAPGHTQPGSRINGIVEEVDLYPTLVELTGLAPRTDLEGQSFVKLLDSPDTQWKQAAFAQFRRNTVDGDRRGYTVRTARYRYTVWLGPADKVIKQELYDHDTDPDELTDVASDPAYAAAVANLESMRRSGWAPVRQELRTRLGL